MDSEQILLGTLIIYPEYIAVVRAELQPADFTEWSHQQLYRLLLQLADQNETIEPYRIHLNAENFINVDELTAIVKSAGAGKNAVEYARHVKKQRQYKDLVKIAEQIKDDVHNRREDAVNRAHTALEDMDKNKPVQVQIAGDLLPQFFEEIEQRQQSGHEYNGLSIGYRAFDQLTHGLKGGQLFVIAGRPSMGKSMLASNIAEAVSIDQHASVLFFSLEMSEPELLTRICASQMHVPAYRFENAKLETDDYRKAFDLQKKLTDKRLFIQYQAKATVSDILAHCRYINYQYGLNLLIIDYLQLLESDERSENETLRIGRITRQLKQLAVSLNIPVILLSQLNRGVEQRVNKQPLMSDLRSSGSIEQDADLIAFIYRDEVYHSDIEDDRLSNAGIAELNLIKNRQGQTGRVLLEFAGEYGQYNEYTNTKAYIPSYTLSSPTKTSL